MLHPDLERKLIKQWWRINNMGHNLKKRNQSISQNKPKKKIPFSFQEKSCDNMDTAEKSEGKKKERSRLSLNINK